MKGDVASQRQLIGLVHTRGNKPKMEEDEKEDGVFNCASLHKEREK